MTQWKPNVVVAAIIAKDGKYLVVEEQDETGQRVINQPAGHLEQGEDLLAAVRREVLEETAWHFEPQGIVGLYLLPKPDPGITYLRICFYGQVNGHDAARKLDHGIIAVHWLTRAELAARSTQHRSPLVMQCLDDYERGQRFPLLLLHHVR